MDNDNNSMNNNIEENNDNFEYNYGQTTAEQQDAQYNFHENTGNMNYNNQYNMSGEKNQINQRAHNFAIASLILGIVSIVLSCCCYGVISLVCAIIGIVLWYNAKDAEGNREGMAKAGMICSIVGIVLAVIMLILLIGFGLLGAFADIY